MTPSPFELAQGIGTQIGGAFKGSRQRSALDDVLGQVSELNETNPQQANMLMNRILSDVAPENRAVAMQVVNNKIAEIKQAKDRREVEDIERRSGFEPGFGRLSTEEQKSVGKRKEDKGSDDVILTSFNRLATLIPRVGTIKSASSYIPTSKTAQRDIGEFDSLLGALESELKDKVSRGTLSNARFNYIVDKLLPKSGSNQATILGKLKGIAKMLNLDSKELKAIEKQLGFEVEDFTEEFKEDITETQSTPSGTEKKRISIEELDL